MQNFKQPFTEVLFIGSGYVGSLSAITMAVQNPQVKFTIYDINRPLIDKWNHALKEKMDDLPIFEPQLDHYLNKVKLIGNLRFEWESHEFEEAYERSQVVFVCVNTPPVVSKSSQLGQQTDMRAFYSVINAIGSTHKNLVEAQRLLDHKIIINKSTVPIGTSQKTHQILGSYIDQKVEEAFTVVSMPEFLAEGQAIKNLVNPDRLVIGTPNSELGKQCYQKLRTLFKKDSNVIHTLNASSEMGKLMSNAMLAQRISSINSLTSLTEKFDDCSIQDIKKIVGSDSRIGAQYLNCSPGFGGSCFEKDLLSLIHILDSNGESIPAQYWQSVLDMNQYQKQRLAKMVAENLQEQIGRSIDFRKPKVCIFGFSYKKNTGDTRLSQSAYIVDYLANVHGFQVSIHDPKVTRQAFEFEMEAQGYEVNNTLMDFCGDDLMKACKECDSVIIMTEWEEFKAYQYDKITEVMKSQQDQLATLYDLRAYIDLDIQKNMTAFDKIFQLGYGTIHYKF